MDDLTRRVDDYQGMWPSQQLTLIRDLEASRQELQDDYLSMNADWNRKMDAAESQLTTLREAVLEMTNECLRLSALHHPRRKP